MFLSEQWVVLWSPSRSLFRVEKLDDYVAANLHRSMDDDRPGIYRPAVVDWIPIAVGDSKEDAEMLMEILA